MRRLFVRWQQELVDGSQSAWDQAISRAGSSASWIAVGVRRVRVGEARKDSHHDEPDQFVHESQGLSTARSTPVLSPFRTHVQDRRINERVSLAPDSLLPS